MEVNTDNARDGNGDFIIHLLNYDGSRLVDFDLRNTSDEIIRSIFLHCTPSIRPQSKAELTGASMRRPERNNRNAATWNNLQANALAGGAPTSYSLVC